MFRADYFITGINTFIVITVWFFKNNFRGRTGMNYSFVICVKL